MAIFGYIAVDKTGKQIKGSMNGEDEYAVAAELKNKGLMPMKIIAQNTMTKDINFQFGGHVKTRDLAVFCRQFVSIDKAGVPIIEAMRLLSEQTENKVLKAAVAGLQVSIEKGETLTASMQKYPKVFPSLFVTTVAAGEASGNLDIAFDRMAVQFEKSSKIESMIKKAMIYPIIVAIVAVAVVVVMLVKVIPAYTDMFNQLGTSLPPITLIVVHMSNFVIHRWYVILAAVAACYLFFQWFAHTAAGQLTIGRLALKVPVFGKLQTKKACSMLSRTMATLFASGVSMIDAIAITGKTMDNVLYRNALNNARDAVIAGQPLSQPLEESHLFPPMLYHMVRIGEETGSTDDMLEKLADYYDEEVEMATQQMMAAMEPMIIIVLAAIVGFLIAAVMSPMLTMYQSLDNM